MDEPEQALAYAEADFAEPHERFVDLFVEKMGAQTNWGSRVLDLGCGPADVSLRFVRRFPQCLLTGVDGSAAMLDLGRQAVERAGLGQRVRLLQRYLPQEPLGAEGFDLLISNSLLHHLQNPAVLWQSIRRYGRSGAGVFVMDLARPDSEQALQGLVARYAAGEPAVLQRDFTASLYAAYRPEEVRMQLSEAGLDHLAVENASDRHLIVFGRL